MTHISNALCADNNLCPLRLDCTEGLRLDSLVELSELAIAPVTIEIANRLQRHYATG